MATGTDLRQITKARLKSANILMSAGDWHGAAYMLGYVLECGLKAVICKNLRLTSYPDNVHNNHVKTFFATHRFDQLLIASGMQDIFSVTGSKECFRHWSEFTVEFPGDWPAMRYDLTRLNQFDETKVRQLYENLTDKRHGIISTMSLRRRW